MARRGYAPDMRGLVPWVGAIIVLVVLWPTVCMSAEGGPATACQSAVFLPLPWEKAPTRGEWSPREAQRF